MNTKIQIEYSSPVHLEIIAAANAGAKTLELVSQFKLTAGTINRIKCTAKSFQTFPIFLTDGTANIPVAEVTTAKGFMHACRHVMRKYSGTFSNMQIPQWRLVSGEESVFVKDIFWDGQS